VPQQDAISIVANPVTPVAYIADGSSNIFEYNVYDGTLISTLAKVAPTIGALAISSDGTTLFVSDTTNGFIIAVDVASGKKIASYNIGRQIDSTFNMVYARPFGQPALYEAGGTAGSTAPGTVIALPSGEVLAGGYVPGIVAVTPNGLKLYTVDYGTSGGANLYGYSVSVKQGVLTIHANVSVLTNAGNCRALAVSQAGAHVYPACLTVPSFEVYSGSTLSRVQTLPAAQNPDNAVIDVNNDFVGGLNGVGEKDDVFIFDQGGFLLGALPTTADSYTHGQEPGAMAVSGDGTRVISATGGAAFHETQWLMLRSIP
jgi:hypothetical protein